MAFVSVEDRLEREPRMPEREPQHAPELASTTGDSGADQETVLLASRLEASFGTLRGARLGDAKESHADALERSTPRACAPTIRAVKAP